MEKFKELGLEGEILNGIKDLGFETPSPVQEKVIPIILEDGHDLVALAQTGTGKTAAFGLPLLQKLDTSKNEIQVLILSPTRELCLQIGKDMKNYSKYRPDIRVACVYGGSDIRAQIRELSRGVHVVVATPGRLCDLIKRRAIHIEGVRGVVLDEADEMLNMGFKEDLNFILDETPSTRRTYLFSATMPREVERISKNYLRDAKEISTGKKNQGADTVTHEYYQVKAKDCYETLHRIIDCEPDMYAIIFVRTRMDARDIVRKLQKDGVECDALHGDLSQGQRDEVMMQFRAKRLKVLVATDVAARGLDVDSLTHVINYNLPEDVESYTHRSGRTGRAGREGTSVCIIHSKEKGKLGRIEKSLGKKFAYKEVPAGEAVCRAQLLHYADKIMTSEAKPTLEQYQAELFEKFETLTKEELVQKMISFEFGKLLKKYASAADINLTDDDRRGDRRGERGDRDDRRGGRREESENEFTTFNVQVGREDGFSPRDLMAIINDNSPRKGLEIGSIRVFDSNTKFEVDIRGVQGFLSCFGNVNYNGLPFSPVQIEERIGRDGGGGGGDRGGRGRGGDRGGRGGDRGGRGGYGGGGDRGGDRGGRGGYGDRGGNSYGGGGSGYGGGGRGRSSETGRSDGSSRGRFGEKRRSEGASDRPRGRR